MIPDFKTYIKESIWGDLARRSGGTQFRAEDDINNLDPEGFAEYLNSHYTPVDYGDQTRYDNIDGSELVVIDVFAFKPFIASLYYHYSQNKVILSSIYADAVKEAYPEFFTKLEDAFSIEVDRDGHNSNRVIFNPKDNSPASNTFFIEVLDKLIEIVGEWNPKSKVEPLMKKNDHISESIWGDLARRSGGTQVRAEDKINSNITELKPVDMGVSVLWADRDLESDENVYFSFPDANKIIEKSGWRLPTWWEMLELTKVSAIYKNTFEECKLRANTNDLVFEKCGYEYADEDRVREPDSYYAWTSDTAKSGSEAYLTIFIRKHIAAVPMHYMNRCCVRLVKDK